MTEAGADLLIVDDNRVNRLLLARSVELLGYRASMAENGRAAMDMLRERRFDLMLLDIEMPEMDGFEVLEAIKLAPALQDLPVIVTSSVEGVDNIVRCIDLGADDYLPKPVNPVLLKARLSSSLEKKRLRDEQATLLKRFATNEVVQDLQKTGFRLGGRRVHATILFCDIRGFTAISERQSPEDTIELLNIYYTLMFEAIDHHSGIVTLMIGDGLMVLFGAPKPLENPAASAVAAAQDMLAIVEQFNLEQAAAAKPEIRLGIGIATGEVVAGFAGTKQRATYTCIGDKVNLASRLEQHTKRVSRPILIDDATRAAVGPEHPCESLGAVDFDGFSRSVAVFAVGSQ
ncbi:adenylate/guanylate cyclase domain-containing protein [Sulfitobacter sabulilitoris]|uniref:Adenylate/guanylate cyclase domain-containing response regulator n=1 Tax=Sulfitobacter sabulilitoris TaxID=2562655 RepID=A0A5S3PLE9_9RHOB|nr:adenylate/guanylate cyclase domain-containing protein [Sulfitobacter sabulilitoris]TMM54390.1 adenylate/guanylate cyclase domain-containing response regulator [Sulfitobacter sabulilitoris]